MTFTEKWGQSLKVRNLPCPFLREQPLNCWWSTQANADWLIDWLIDDHHKPLMIHTASCKFKLQLFSAANNSICSPNDLFYWPCYVLLINARGVYLEIPLSPLRSGDPLVHGFASFVLRESYLTWYSKVTSVMYR